jgi:signal transduction histidine kinase
MASADQPTVNRFRLLGWAFALTGLAIVGVLLFAFVVNAISLVGLWIGIPLTLLSLPMLQRFADLHRRWAGSMLGEEIPSPCHPSPDEGMLAQLTAAATDPARWRDLAWLLVNSVAGVALAVTAIGMFLGAVAHLVLFAFWPALPQDAEVDLLGGVVVHDQLTAAYFGIPLGVVYLFLWWWASPWLMRANAHVIRWLLAPTEKERLAGRVRELSESRAETVDTQAAELRRIERDLHDGAQARLVSLGMSLGMAEDLLATNPKAAQELLAEARESTSAALSELRDLVRGIHPPVLADRGLEGAVRALALGGPLPVEVEIALPGRPPAPVESAVYFAVAEALTNTAKHSGASRAWVRIRHADERLTATVADDGRGGAAAAAGGGLRGIQRRLAAFDGTLSVTSPPGGPSVLTMELPCALSSAKTSSSSETG